MDMQYADMIGYMFENLIKFVVNILFGYYSMVLVLAIGVIIILILRFFKKDFLLITLFGSKK